MGFLASLRGLRTSKTKTKASNVACTSSEYRGVQVNPNNADCCMAVKALKNKRFLSGEVPKLPLDGCDANECQCTYELYHDRRTDIRRAADVTYDMASQYFEHGNRNNDSTGRRTDD